MKIMFMNYGRENLGIEYMSSILKNAGHQVVLAHDPGYFTVQDNVMFIPLLARILSRRKGILDQVRMEHPDLVCFSVYTNNYAYMLDLAIDIRKFSSAKIIFGGAHPTAAPETVMANACIDAVVVGEGEEAILDIARSFKQGAIAADIRNTWVRQNDRISRNELRPPCHLDHLPLPDKDLFKDHIDHSKSYLILTSRGCPHSCIYCGEESKNKLYQNKFFRRRSVDSVINELRVMKSKYAFKEVIFFDAIFFTDKEWLKLLMSRYKTDIGVPFKCFGEVNCVNEEVILILKEAGCYGIEFGLQNINAALRGNVLGRPESNEEIFRAFEICDRLEVRYDIDHIFGLPHETEDDFLEAAVFYAHCRQLNRIKCHNLTYFPQAKIMDIARCENILDDHAVRDIYEGRGGDFFHVDSARGKSSKKLKDDFWNFFRLIPMLPRSFSLWLINSRGYVFLRYIPSFVIIVFQAIDMLVKGDRRFQFHFNKYIYSRR